MSEKTETPRAMFEFVHGGPTNDIAIDIAMLQKKTRELDQLFVPINDSVYVKTIGDTMIGPLFIDGSTDAIQLKVQAVAGQTNDVFVVENSAGVNFAAITFEGQFNISPVSGDIGLAIIGTMNDNTQNFGIYLATTFTGTGGNKGLFFNPNQTSISASGYYGIDDRPRFAATAGGPQVSFYGLLGVPTITAAASANVTDMYCGYFRADNLSTAGSILNVAYGVYVANANSTGTINYQYGLLIADQDKGGILNYSIVTYSGSVVLNAGRSVSADFYSYAATYNAIFVDTSNDSIVLMSNALGKLGFFGAAAIVKGAAFTQTYSTASHTITQTAMTDPGAYGAGANGYSTAAQASAIHAEVIALKANMIVTQNVLNGLIDDLQALGLV